MRRRPDTAVNHRLLNDFGSLVAVLGVFELHLEVWDMRYAIGI